MKLEDIPKKNPFTVPDGYFDRLPGRVQTRIEAKRAQSHFSWSFSWKYAVAMVLIIGAGAFWYAGGFGREDIQSELSSIAPDQLVFFLEDQDVTSDELAAQVDWNNQDINELENTVYSEVGTPLDADQVINDMDSEL